MPRSARLSSGLSRDSLSACQFSPDIPTRAVNYNQAVAQSTNEIILLNILRAADQRPRYFTRLGTNSAQATVSGGLSLSFPFPNFTHGSGGASGAGTSENTFTLENLDDKKYQDGAMQPVAASAANALWAQGVPPELLGLLLIPSIAMPKAELPIIRDVLAQYCGDMRHSQRYCGTDASLIASEHLAGNWTGADCLDPNRVPTDRRGGVDYAVYTNDPAAEDTAGSYHPELCFQIVLRDLLAIGLHPEKRSTLTDMEVPVSQTALNDGNYTAELIKQGVKVGKDGKLHKQSDEIVLALDPAATAQIRVHPNFRSAVLRCMVFAARGIPPDDKWHCPPAKDAGESDLTFNTRTADYDRDYARIVASDETKGVPVPLDDLKIRIGLRSFEDIISFLGAVVRTSRGETAPSSASAPYVVHILGRQPNDPDHNSIYEEALFDLRRGSPAPDAAIVLSDDGGHSNWIPAFCNSAAQTRSNASVGASACSIEYPDHDTLTVLALVNQIWGLQKEPSPNAQPILTLGG